MMVERKLTQDPGHEPGLIPDSGIGPFLPVTDEDVEIFNDILGDEIDSAFESTICCCDFCYEDFKRHWPEVAFRETAFQTESMEAWWFLEYSRMIDLYSPAEMSTLRHFVQCLRCGRFGSHNLWLYEHLFSDAPEIEAAVDELLVLGSNTPFLMLDHPFARRVFDQIRSLAATAAPRPVGVRIYRARLAAEVAGLGQDPAALTTYAPPPSAHVGEGRFNHAGSPMLYAASTPVVATTELGRPGEHCYVAELRIATDLKVLDLVDLEEGSEGFELMKALASSALLLAPNSGEGWLKPQYVFSRFVADCARSAGFDAIRYGSTKLVSGTNIVILNPPADFSALASLVRQEGLVSGEPDKRY
jgi:hypothetical protein